MVADTSSSAAAKIPAVGDAAAAFALPIAEPTPAKSVAAAAKAAGIVVTKDIEILTLTIASNRSGIIWLYRMTALPVSLGNSKTRHLGSCSKPADSAWLNRNSSKNERHR